MKHILCLCIMSSVLLMSWCDFFWPYFGVSQKSRTSTGVNDDLSMCSMEENNWIDCVAAFHQWRESYDITQKSVLWKGLTLCSTDPMTWWFRDGYCRTDSNDTWVHVVCAQVTDAFLTYSQAQGNDLITPSARFPGLKDGDHRCLCGSRWLEAQQAGISLEVNRSATHELMRPWYGDA